MTTTFKRLLSLILILISALAFLPKLTAYTPESIALDITIRTPLGTDYQYTLPTPLGNNVSISLDGLYPSLDFVYFIHEGNTYTNQSMQFTVSGSTKVTAIYKAPNTYTLTYLDTNNDIIDVIYGDQDNFVVTLPLTNPSKPGYNFIRWDLPNEVAGDVIVRPIYELIENTVAITVNNQVINYHYNEVVTLSPTNTNFSYWADQDGQVVSTNPNYRFSALMPSVLNEVSNVSIDIKPRIYLSNVTGIREGFISLLGYIDHPRANIIEYGILASASEQVLTILNSTKIPSQSLADTNEFLRTFEGDTYKSFRAYAILSNHTIIYSDNTHFIKLTETFNQNFNTNNWTTVYRDGEYLGLDGVIFTYKDARRANDALIGNGGLVLRRASTSYIEFTLPKETTSLSFNYKKALTSSAIRELEVLINDVQVATSPRFEMDNDVRLLALDNLNYQADFVVRIKNIGTTTTDRLITINNIKWTMNIVPNISTRLHQVSFNYLGAQVNRIVQTGNTVIEPTLPVLETHTFEGWYLNAEFTGDPFDINSPIEQSVTLYAKWQRILDSGNDVESLEYHIDFGNETETGFGQTSITFTNTSNSTPYTLSVLRAEINTFNSDPALHLAPKTGYQASYIEFDLTLLTNTIDKITFDYSALNSTALTYIKAEDRQSIIRLEVYMNDSWVPLTSIDNLSNLVESLPETYVDAYQNVAYTVPGNYKYRIVYNTPGTYTNYSNLGQLLIIDNFMAYSVENTTPLNPVFLDTASDIIYAVVGSDFEVTPPTAIDRFGRVLETSLVDITYDMDELGIYELVYEVYDYELLYATYTLYLHVIESMIPEDLPEMDEANLVELKDRFQTDRNKLAPGFNALSEQGLLDYYAGLNGLTGASFKQALQNILVSTHRRNISYDEARFVLEQSDAVMTPEGTYLHGIYSSTPIVRYWDAGATWAREHVWPNSKLGIPRVSGSSRNLGSDPHNLRAINPSVNSSRSNRYFDKGTGSFGTIESNAYDPGLDHRGDVARIFFYMFVRYESLDLSSVISEVLAGENYTSSATTMGLLNVLIQWHLDDPVDQFEINRNNIIFSYQGNRNPFIDNPSYVGMLFS